MSDIGQSISSLLQINANASQIETRWLREAVLAISVLARPLGILLIGFAIAHAMWNIGAHATITENDVWLFVAGCSVFTGAVAMRSWDKRTAAAGGQ